MKKRIPEWVTNETLIDRWEHDTAEAWFELHQHPTTGQNIYIAADTSGCDGGLIGVYDDFADASNAVGDQEGYTELWTKQ